jgi:hypothetical protein
MVIALCNVGSSWCNTVQNATVPEAIQEDEEDSTDVFAIPLDTSVDEEDVNEQEAKQIEEQFAKDEAAQKKNTGK